MIAPHAIIFEKYMTRARGACRRFVSVLKGGVPVGSSGNKRGHQAAGIKIKRKGTQR